jgi:hypothetical protein
VTAVRRARPHPDDADNPLRVAFGNEASERDIEECSRHFGCAVVDSFGSSEGEIRIVRAADTLRGSLGGAPPGVLVLDPVTLRECPPGRFDDRGRLLNPEEAVSEIVNQAGAWPAAFLASDQGVWITGQSWNVDSGQLTIRCPSPSPYLTR